MKYSLIYKNGKVWSSPSMLGKIDDAVKGTLKVYATLCRKDNQNYELCFDCASEDRNIKNTESCYALGDISAKWETVRPELENKKMPEEWRQIIETEKMEDKKMAVQEQESNKEVKDNMEKPVETAAENTESNLPPISKDSPYAVLARKDGYQLNMQICGDMSTMRSDGCRLYLTDIQTGKLYISSSSEITISKAKILSASDHAVMNVLSNFIVDFGENDKKKAFDRAKHFLEVVTNITNMPSSRCIEDILNDVVDSIKTKASGDSSGNYKYDVQEGTVSVISDQFQKLLDEIDAGCTKTVFCKKLRMVEQHYGKTIIISNRGGTGYGFNDTNNRRYYKFVADLFKTDVAEA
nr:hypothetical protein [uncultured Acetatifactor sp.]